MAKKKAAPKPEKKPAKKAGAPEGNQNAVGNNGGRPPIYASAEELQAKIEEYFEYIKGVVKEEREIVNQKTGATQFHVVWERPPEPPTITGLALHLGFADRQSLNDYEEKVEFSFIIKRARTRVENGYEKALHAQSPTGAIFALKNMKWKDKTEVDNTNTNTNTNLNLEMTPEEIKAYKQALQDEF